LISFGRSSLICTLFSIGILLNISQRKKVVRR
jgi:cell division protein FtsW